jgi:hypothetical protein
MNPKVQNLNPLTRRTTRFVRRFHFGTAELDHFFRAGVELDSEYDTVAVIYELQLTPVVPVLAAVAALAHSEPRSLCHSSRLLNRCHFSSPHPPSKRGTDPSIAGKGLRLHCLP